MEIYKTLKRQISGSVGDGQSSSTGHAKYGGGSGKTWIHPPDVLLNGRVEYGVKLLGSKEVQKSKGTDTIREAIHAIRFQLQVKRSETGHSGSKLQKVDLQISIEGITVVDTKTKMVLHRYPLQRISFCADDKQDKRVFSFIAKAEEGTRHDCFVFLSDKLAEQITLTVGEAFDLAYKRYMDNNRASLENQKQSLLLKKRIAELEEENQMLLRMVNHLKNQNQDLQNLNTGNPFYPFQLSNLSSVQVTSQTAPPVPTTPIPPKPPQLPPRNAHGVPPPLPPQTTVTNEYVCSPSSSMSHSPPTTVAPGNLYTVPTRLSVVHTQPLSILDTPISNAPVANSSGVSPPPQAPPPSTSSGHSSVPTTPPPLCPPPPVVPRRGKETTPNQPPGQSAEVGRRLENLQLNQMDTLFDDSFDPRGSHKNEGEDKKKDDDPFGDDFLADVIEKGEKAEKQTAADIEKMINQVDKRLAEMSSGFSNGKLEMGDTGDALRDIDVESEYGSTAGDTLRSTTNSPPTSTAGKK